ncbi:MAG: tyrosine-type recombinase/integrase [Acutalibacteraceae bacterium]|nr:tyrosine-type recombinase/integrase [Acutalibacteraceae bacterium]
MLCVNRRCHKEIGDFKFCPHCGKNQFETRRDKKRANGTGSVYKRKDNKSKPYTASSSLSGTRVSLGSFETKAQALKALADYEQKLGQINLSDGLVTVDYIFQNYVLDDIKTLSPSSQKNYMLAWYRLEPLHQKKIIDIKKTDIQEIVDHYSKDHQLISIEGKPVYLDAFGRKTTNKTDYPKIVKPLAKGTLHQIIILMKKIYKVALENDWTVKNYSDFVVTNKTPTKERNNMSCFNETDISYLFDKLENKNIDETYIDYILCLCYLNYRVNEFLSLTKEQYHITADGIPYFIAGQKTEAGKDRIIPIHPNIQKFVKDCIERNGETIFCDKKTKKALKYGKFRYKFDCTLAELGFSSFYTPHSCRRTFSTRLSATGVNDADLTALMGHTSINVDIKHYINQEVHTLYNAITKMK